MNLRIVKVNYRTKEEPDIWKNGIEIFLDKSFVIFNTNDKDGKVETGTVSNEPNWVEHLTPITFIIQSNILPI